MKSIKYIKYKRNLRVFSIIYKYIKIIQNKARKYKRTERLKNLGALDVVINATKIETNHLHKFLVIPT